MAVSTKARSLRIGKIPLGWIILVLAVLAWAGFILLGEGLLSVTAYF